jgi:O-antigen/teichoic acid export membrane protein
MMLAALALPTITLAAGLRGYLEAHQRFALLGLIRATTGALLLIAPVLALAYSHKLPALMTSIVAVRVVSLAAHFAACIHISPELWTARALRWRLAPPLAKFGGWLTVTNIVSPLMVSIDRFLIGGQMAATDVAYYATPYEIVTKYLMLPLALTAVLFQSFSSGPGAETRRLYWGSLRALAAILAPLTLVTVVLARPGLQWWVGAEMATHGYRVLQLLAVGVFINGIAQVPFTFIQGVGRPDLTAKFHLIELPVYAAALWCGIHWWGIEGAAVAWVGRVAVDAGLLMWCSGSISGSECLRQAESSAEPALV